MSGPWIIAFVSLWLVVALLGILVLGLLRRVNDVLVASESRPAAPEPVAAEALAVGARVPEFAAATESGEPTTFTRLGMLPAVYLLVRAGCSACDALLADMAGQPAPLGPIPLLLVADDTARAHPSLTAVNAVRIYQRHAAVARAFECWSAPYAFAVDAQGTVTARGAAHRVAELRRLAGTLAPG